MDISVIWHFADGSHRVVGESYADLRQAVGDALSLADRRGKDARDEDVVSSRFDVRVTGRLELSVAVVRGGLL